MRIEAIGISFGVLWLLAIGYLVSHYEFSLPEIRFWPKFKAESSEMGNEEYIVERVRHRSDEGTDMNNGVYLTHHRYFLEAITSWQLEYANTKFTLNDICYKPHYSMIKSDETETLSPIMRTLEVEAKQKSPCLIVSPLNCFQDSFKLHSDISHWTTDTEVINKRIRSLYIEDLKDNETKPYVKGANALEVIEGWLKILGRKTFKGDEMLKKLHKWIDSLKPKSRLCIDPLRSCEAVYDPHRFFNLCTDVSNFSNETKLDIKLENDDIEFIKTIDCVENRDVFIEWAKEKELLKMFDTFSNDNETTIDEILSGSCNGIFGEEIDKFETAHEGSIDFDIYLMTPSEMLNSLNQNSIITNSQTNWTLEDAEDIINSWRTMIRNQAEVMNNRKMSRRLNVVTKATSKFNFDSSHSTSSVLKILPIIFLSALILSSLFLWSSTLIYSTFTFTLRTLLGILFVFNFYADHNGFFECEKRFMMFAIFLIVLNIIQTFWISRGIDKKSRKNSGSNHGSLSNVSQKSYVFEKWSLQEMLQYFDKYLKKEERLEEMKSEQKEVNPELWVLLLISFLLADSLVDIILLIGPTMIMIHVEKFILERKKKNLTTLVERVRKCRTRLVEEVRREKEKQGEGEGVEMVEIQKSETGHQHLQHSISPAPSRNSISNSQHQGPLAKMQNSIRHYAAVFYSENLVFSKKSALSLSIISICLLSSSILALFFTTPILDSSKLQYSEDVFFDVEFHSVKNDWEKMLEFEKEIRRYGEEVTNWRSDFENYMKKKGLCISEKCRDLPSFEEFYVSWYTENRISSAISAKNGQPNSRVFTDFFNPSKFRFRLRFDIQPQNFEKVLQICQIYDVAAFGNGKGFTDFQKNYVIRDTFVGKHLWNSSTIFVVGWICAKVVFNLKFGLLFTFCTIATKFEVEAVIWVFFNTSPETLGNHQLISNFALLLGLLIAWNPFISLLSYRIRVKHEVQRESLSENETLPKSTLPCLAFADNALLLTTVICLWFVSSWSILLVSNWPTALSTSLLCLSIIVISSFNTMTLLSKQPYLFDCEIRDVMKKRRLFRQKLVPKKFCDEPKSVDEQLESVPIAPSISSEPETEHEDEGTVESIRWSDEFDSEDSMDENVATIVKNLEERYEENKKAEFLKNIVSSDKMLKQLEDEAKTLEQRKQQLLQDLNNQPSCSSNNHKYGHRYPPDWTNEMVEFMNGSEEEKEEGGPSEVAPSRADLATRRALGQELYNNFESTVEATMASVPVEPVVVEVVDELSSEGEDEGFGGGEESD